MIEVFRVVEDQAHVYGFKATGDQEEAVQLETLIDLTKPKLEFSEWDVLIATQFRYALPVGVDYAARFRPPYFSKNVFYSSEFLETALYEYGYHLMRQRVHLFQKKKKKETETGSRTGFSVHLDHSGYADVGQQSNSTAILSKNDYSASHDFIKANKDIEVVKYSSVRDPSARPNYAVFTIQRLEKEINRHESLEFFYDYKKKELYWINQELKIAWATVG